MSIRLVVYNESGIVPDWFQIHPYQKYSKIIIGGPSQAAAVLKYMIEQYEQQTDLVTMFIRTDSSESMVKEIGYNLKMMIDIIANKYEKGLFRWFWPIGVIGVCDHEGYPHYTGLPLRQMFQLAEVEMPAVVPFIFDQTFAIKHETMVSIKKSIYEDLLASQERFGASWEPCMIRLWLSLYRASNTKSSF